MKIAAVCVTISPEPVRRFDPSDNDCLMAKRQKAFRRAALLLSAAVWLLRRIFIAMSIGRMLDTIIRHPIIMVIRR